MKSYFFSNTLPLKTPWSKEKNKKKSRKKQGGQPGHKGRKHNLLSTEQMDKVHDCYSEQCEECGNHFADDKKKPTDKPARYQWLKLPVIVSAKTCCMLPLYTST